MTITIGSRESALAVIQSEIVMAAIRKAHPELTLELLTMKTTGDRILDRTLDKIGGKGLFVKELCAALREGRVDLRALMERLGEENIDSLLLEGGGALNWAALEQGIVQKIQAYIAPKIFGGAAAKTPVAGIGVELPSQAVRLKNTVVVQLGKDFLLESEVDGNVYGDC